MIWYFLSFWIWLAFAVLLAWYCDRREPYQPRTVWQKQSPYFQPDPMLTE